jgi:hypothetical protein
MHESADPPGGPARDWILLWLGQVEPARETARVPEILPESFS